MNGLRYSLLPSLMMSMGSDAALVRRFGDEQPLVISQKLLQAMNHCRGLHTLEDHEKSISLSFGHSIGDSAAHEAVIELLAKKLLVEETELSRYFFQPTVVSPSARSTVSDIAIVTNDRVATLKHTVESILHHSRIHDRLIRISIYDDSRSAVAQHNNINMLQSLPKREHCEIRYASRSDREKYLQKMCQVTGIESRIVGFALLGRDSESTTIGSNRNSALLDLAGSPCLFIDDDVLFKAAPSARFHEGIQLSSGHPAKSEFHEDLDLLLGFTADRQNYIPDLHSSLLGMLVSDCIHQTRQGLLAIDCGSALWRSVLERKARISVTQMGIIGDSAQGSRNWLLSVTGDQRARNFESEEKYRIACTTSYAQRIAEAATITDSAFCMTYATALDNSNLLPPFFPIGRNSDGIFGITLRFANPSSYIAHLPYGIVHRRPTSTGFDRERVWRDSTSISISDILIVALKSCPGTFIAGRQDLNYMAIGQHLQSIARMDNYDFLDFFRRVLWKRNARRIQEYEQLLDDFGGQPAFWAEDVRKAIEAIITASSDDAFGLPSDVYRANNVEDRIRLTRRLVGQFGALMRCWPVLRETAERRTHDPAFRLSRKLY